MDSTVIGIIAVAVAFALGTGIYAVILWGSFRAWEQVGTEHGQDPFVRRSMMARSVAYGCTAALLVVGATLALLARAVLPGIFLLALAGVFGYVAVRTRLSVSD